MRNFVFVVLILSVAVAAIARPTQAQWQLHHHPPGAHPPLGSLAQAAGQRFAPEQMAQLRYMAYLQALYRERFGLAQERWPPRADPYAGFLQVDQKTVEEQIRQHHHHHQQQQQQQQQKQQPQHHHQQQQQQQQQSDKEKQQLPSTQSTTAFVETEARASKPYKEQAWTYKDLKKPPKWLVPEKPLAPGLPLTKPPPVPRMVPPPPPFPQFQGQYGQYSGSSHNPPPPTYSLPRPPPAALPRWIPWSAFYAPGAAKK